MARRVTQADVARLAGVSRFTVSSVINDNDGGNIRISQETRQRVLDAVEKLGYKPNVIARSLRTSRTMMLAVMVDDIANPFYSLFIRGIEKSVGPHGYDILIYNANGTQQRELTLIDKALTRLVDGVIMVPFHLTRQDLKPLVDAEIPTVMVCGQENENEDLYNGFSYVIPDERQGVLDIMNYLISHGHRRIAHIAGPQNTPPGRIRMNWYRRALESAGIAYDESLVCYGTFQSDKTSELVAFLFPSLKSSASPTALFAANDVMAIEAIQALKRRGWRIPEDVAVAGYDNIPEAGFVFPGLTTVENNPLETGRIAGDLMIEHLSAGAGGCEGKVISVPCQLVIRESV